MGGESHVPLEQLSVGDVGRDPLEHLPADGPVRRTVRELEAQAQESQRILMERIGLDRLVAIHDYHRSQHLLARIRMFDGHYRHQTCENGQARAELSFSDSIKQIFEETRYELDLGGEIKLLESIRDLYKLETPDRPGLSDGRGTSASD